jgi:hypothetical protein
MMARAAQLRPAIGRAIRAKDPEAEKTARQDYITAYTAETIEKLLSKAPPLRPEQLERLRSLIPTPVVDEPPGEVAA